MATKTSFQKRISWLVLFSFFTLASFKAWPAAEKKRSQPNHAPAGRATETGQGVYEKDEPSTVKKTKGRHFPVVIVLGAAVAAGVLVYLLTAKKDKSDDEEQSLVIQPAGTVADFDGHVYQTVRIGNQVWMAENLKSTHYNDGSPINSLVYNNDEANAATYGRLYKPEAFMRGAAGSGANPSGIQGAAPQGWHIPSPAEWQQLITALGGPAIAGGKMKESGTAHWLSPNTGATNESLFAALPSGMHRADLVFQWLGTRCVFASSQHNANDQTIVTLWHDRTEATSEGYHPDDAVSVRCVKD